MAEPSIPPGFDFTDPDLYATRVPMDEFAELRRAGYAVSLVTEGMSRLLPCVVIVGLGAGSAFVYCLVFACGLFFSAATGSWWLRPLP